jgi:hypothetical protein
MKQFIFLLTFTLLIGIVVGLIFGVQISFVLMN